MKTRKHDKCHQFLAKPTWQEGLPIDLKSMVNGMEMRDKGKLLYPQCFFPKRPTADSGCQRLCDSFYVWFSILLTLFHHEIIDLDIC